jgi:hypothetical protein
MSNRAKHVASLVAILTLCGASASALENEFISDEVPTGLSREGAWTFNLNVNSSANVSSNRRVVGQLEGTGITVGLSLGGEIRYDGGPHEFRNTLSIEESFSRTPVVDEFVKSADSFIFESIYYYHLPTADWFGPFARFRMDTALFQGFDVRPDAVTYSVSQVNGDVIPVVADRLRLTDGFNPLTLKQSVGAFAQPIRETEVNVDFRLGLGSRQTFADGQLVLADDVDTADFIEVNELQNFSQVGAETVLEVTGSFEEERVSYLASAEALFPFVDSLGEESGRSTIEATNVEIRAEIAFALTDWASLNYQLRAMRIPSLVEDWQVSNGLLLTLGGAWTKRVVTRTWDVPDTAGLIPVPDAPVVDAAPDASFTTDPPEDVPAADEAPAAPAPDAAE